MPSEVDIANLALLHIGDSGSVASFTENSFQAELCRRFYPVARDSLLEMHDWSFALKRVQPAQVTNIITEWSYTYSLPSDCIRVISVLRAGATGDQYEQIEYNIGNNSNPTTQDYIVEALPSGALGIYTNIEAPDVRYIARIIDPNKFTPLFCNALSRLLASYLTGPIIKGDAGRAEAKGQLQIFDLEFQKARLSDSSARATPIANYSSFIASR